ncbi:hypothetical protein TWF481_007008 [Arthrobotrys musiformis]|uniref:DUF6603 domain-containing protein n=1 Tax=Arthrobotrys musiformis TaxID=47236 RepID=A0AAV9WC32_9PEZI
MSNNEWVVQSFHINVGAGDAAIHVRAVATTDGEGSFATYKFDRAVLIDGGDGNAEGVANIKRLLEELPSQYTNIEDDEWLKLDAVVITHWDSDHWEGVKELMSKTLDDDGRLPFFKYEGVGKNTKYLTTFYSPHASFPSGSGFKADEKSKPPTIQFQGNTIAKFYHGRKLLGTNFFEEVTLLEGKMPGSPKELFDARKKTTIDRHPAMFCVSSNTFSPLDVVQLIDAPITKENQRSIASVITWPKGNITHYFAGDLHYQNETAISKWVKAGQTQHVKAHIPTIKLSHHGAKSSTPVDMFEQYQPDTVIISAGGKHGHPSPETVLWLLGWFIRDKEPKDGWNEQNSLMVTQYPYWMVVGRNGKYKPFHRFTMQPFLKIPEKEATGKKKKIYQYQQALKEYFANCSDVSNIWKTLQTWASENTKKVRDKVDRVEAFTEVCSNLSSRFNHYSPMRVNTIPEAQKATTGTLAAPGEQVWYIAVFQADPRNTTAKLKSTVFWRRQCDYVDLEEWRSGTPARDLKTKKMEEYKETKYTKKVPDEERSQRPDCIAGRLRSQSKAPPSVLLSRPSPSIDDDEEGEEEVVFDRPPPDTSDIPTVLDWCIAFSGFKGKDYIPKSLTFLPKDHSFDYMLSTLPWRILSFDISKLQQIESQWAAPLHEIDGLFQWMNTWAGARSITGIFNLDPSGISGTPDAIPHSLQIALGDENTPENQLLFSTDELNAALGLDLTQIQGASDLGTFKDLGTIGFGLSKSSPTLTGTGADIFKATSEYFQWDPNTMPKSFLTSLILNSEWQLKRGQQVGQRGSALWYTPSAGNLVTCRLEFEFGSGDASKEFQESIKKLLGNLGDNILMEHLGMAFKWSSSQKTAKTSEGGKVYAVHGDARIWLHSQIRLSQNFDPVDIEIDIYSEDDFPAIIINGNLKLNDAIDGLASVVQVPSMSAIHNITQSTFFPTISFRRLTLQYDDQADKFKTRRLALDLETSFHTKGKDDFENDAPVSISICLAYQPNDTNALSFRAKMWSPNLPPLSWWPPYALLPAYEHFDDFGPAPGVASSVSILSFLPDSCEVIPPPAGIPTEITSLGFGYEDQVLSVWGTIEKCTLPNSSLPLVDLGLVAITGSYSFADDHPWSLGLLFSVQIAPPPDLVDTDAVGLSLLDGSISYDSSQKTWAIEANVIDLSLAHIWQFFQTEQKTAMIKVLSAIILKNLHLRYDLQKYTGEMVAQSASGFYMTADIHLGGDPEIATLYFKYDYPQNGPWTMVASLSTTQAPSQNITLEDLLQALSPTDSLLKQVFGFLGRTVIVKASSTPSLTVRISPESHRKSDNTSKTSINLRVTLELANSIKFSYCQYTSAEPDKDGNEKDTLKRFLSLTIHSFEIPTVDIPALKEFTKPFDDLYILWTDSDLPQSELTMLDSEFAAAYLANGKHVSNDGDDFVYTAGFHVGIIAGGEVILDHLFGEQSGGENEWDETALSPLNPSVFPSDRKISVSSNASTTKWQKKIGPLTISNIGLKFEDGALIVLLDAALKAGPMEMQLMGFGLGVKLEDLSNDKITLVGSLSGFGLSVDSPPILLSGALMHQNNIFSGGVMASFDPYLFQAAGAYGTVDDIKAAFIILALGGPLLNINGIMISDITAGFGYNSDLNFPDPTSVSSFPLIAIGQPPAPLQPLDIFRNLMKRGGGWIIPTEAAYWIGAGLKGSAFNMLDAKIAAVFKIQNERLSQVGVFANCTARMPKKPAKKIFASIELGITAVFDLIHGSMMVSARLSPSSYILDPDCQLTGGFAAGSWFGPSPYAGDWVFSLGGYHPKYTPPAYYPQTIPQVGVTWKIDDRILIKAGGYFAITPKVCMGGASIMATCDVCGLHASFRALVDFLMNFEPFHYVLDVSIDISVSWRARVFFVWTNISADISANLHMCGPPVYGVFTIDVPIKNITVEFGDRGSRNPPDKVSLEAFRKMLRQSPDDNTQEVKISCRSGMLVKDDSSKEAVNSSCWNVRAGTFAFEVRSNVATSQLWFNGSTFGGASKIFAKPMWLQADSVGLDADLKITISGASDTYRPDAIVGALPAALWSPYDPKQDPSSSSSNKSALLSGSSSTVSSVYGISVQVPQPLLCKDQIKKFKVGRMVSDIGLPDSEGNKDEHPPPPVPSPSQGEPAWEGVAASGDTIAAKRRTIRNLWENPPQSRGNFANAWIGALGWEGFTPNTQAPSRLLERFDSLVRGTPLVTTA